MAIFKHNSNSNTFTEQTRKKYNREIKQKKNEDIKTCIGVIYKSSKTLLKDIEKKSK